MYQQIIEQLSEVSRHDCELAQEDFGALEQAAKRKNAVARSRSFAGLS